MVAVYLRYDNQYDSYSRKNNDLLSILAALGGLQRTLHAIGFIFVSVLSSKMFSSQIIKNLYQIRKYDVFEQQIRQAKKIKRKRVTKKNKETPVDFEKNQNVKSPKENLPKWYHTFSRVFRNDHQLDKPTTLKE